MTISVSNKQLVICVPSLKQGEDNPPLFSVYIIFYLEYMFYFIRKKFFSHAFLGFPHF